MESDAEFVERIKREWDGDNVPCVEDFDQLIALARRGAAVQTVGHLDDGKTAILKAAGLHKTSQKILEQAARIRQLETGLWDVHAYCNNWDWFLWMWPIRRIKRIVKSALKEASDE